MTPGLLEATLQRAADDAAAELDDELDQADRNPRHDSRRVEFARQREKMPERHWTNLIAMIKQPQNAVGQVAGVGIVKP